MNTAVETKQATRRRWRLVKQNGADSYLLVLMATFGATVIIVTGLSAFMAVVFLSTGRDQLGLRAGTLALVLALTIVNLITFYFNQLYTVAEAIGQLFLLFMTQVYRWRFYAGQPAEGQP